MMNSKMNEIRNVLERALDDPDRVASVRYLETLKQAIDEHDSMLRRINMLITRSWCLVQSMDDAKRELGIDIPHELDDVIYACDSLQDLLIYLSSEGE